MHRTVLRGRGGHERRGWLKRSAGHAAVCRGVWGPRPRPLPVRGEGSTAEVRAVARACRSLPQPFGSWDGRIALPARRKSMSCGARRHRRCRGPAAHMARAGNQDEREGAHACRLLADQGTRSGRLKRILVLQGQGSGAGRRQKQSSAGYPFSDPAPNGMPVRSGASERIHAHPTCALVGRTISRAKRLAASSPRTSYKGCGWAATDRRTQERTWIAARRLVGYSISPPPSTCSPPTWS
jgi:hypothetical protein